MLLFGRYFSYYASFLLVSHLVGGAPIAKTALRSSAISVSQDRIPEEHAASSCQLRPQQTQPGCRDRSTSRRYPGTSITSMEQSRPVVASESREVKAWPQSAPVSARSVRREEKQQGKKKSDKTGIWIIVAIAVVFALIVVAVLCYHWRNIKRACGGFWKRSREQSEGKHLRGRVENRDPADYVPLVAGLKLAGVGVDVAGP